MKIKRQLMLGLAGLAVAILAGSVPAQAKSKLPKSYRGDWYGYVCSEKDNHVRTYYAVKLRFTSNRMDYNYLQTTKANLSQLKWQWGEKSLVTYKQRTDKHHRAYYELNSEAFMDDLTDLQLTTVKVNGKATPALNFWGEADAVYAFRQPVRAQAWGEDFEGYIPTDE
ncbi:hypothetical protein [Levilactobacillus sp. N40-8-2]|uniref:hypothetical protein n=1 Tax=Levilactobacillus muriae TaxID=3238987 RepID=UPI0038B2C692